MTLLAIRLLGFLLARLPTAGGRILAAMLGEGIYRLMPGRRRVVLSNLAHAFPERPHAWHVRTARASCRRLVETGMLAAAFPCFDERDLRRMVSLGSSVPEALRVAAEQPGPIVAGVPHLGAWELLAALPLVAQQPLPVIGCLYRPLNQPVLDRWVRGARERFGLRLLSRKEGLTEGQRILRDGGCFCILFDQRPRDSGVLTLFMDRVCASSNLPELMVHKFGARLAMVFARRLSFWRYQLEIHLETPSAHEPGAVTRRLDDALARLLRSDDALCASWLWLHDRWKTQMAPERRFRLEHKHSILPQGAPLPRSTRFFVRLPDEPAAAAALVPVVARLRDSRPDAALIAIAQPPAAARLETAGAFDAVWAIPEGALARWRFFAGLRRRHPDCWIQGADSPRADLEARVAGCPQRFAIGRPGRRRRWATHVWRVPPELADAGPADPRLWDGFLRHFGWREAPP